MELFRNCLETWDSFGAYEALRKFVKRWYLLITDFFPYPVLLYNFD